MNLLVMSSLDATKARGISLALKQCIKELQRDTAKSRVNTAISAVLPSLEAIICSVLEVPSTTGRHPFSGPARPGHNIIGFSRQKAALSREEIQLLLDNQIPARSTKLATSLVLLALSAKNQGPNQLVAQAAPGVLSTEACKAIALATVALDAFHQALQGPQAVAWLQQVVPCMEDGIPGEDGLLPPAIKIHTSCMTLQ